jgi:hypothetical protein
MKKLLTVLSLFSLPVLAGNVAYITGEAANDIYQNLDADIHAADELEIKTKGNISCSLEVDTEDVVCAVATKKETKYKIRAGRRVRVTNNQSTGSVEFTYRAGHRVMVNPNKPSGNKVEFTYRAGKRVVVNPNESTSGNVEYTWRAGRRVVKR